MELKKIAGLSRDAEIREVEKIVGGVKTDMNDAAITGRVIIDWEQGNVFSGGEQSSSKVIRNRGYIAIGERFAIDCKIAGDVYSAAVLEYDENLTYKKQTQMTEGQSITLMGETKFIRCKLSHVDASEITPDKGADLSIFFAPGYRTDVVTPVMFGAIGDGVTDDSKAFQDALNAGSRVYIPFEHGQVYRITKTLNIPATCRMVYGSGRSSSGRVLFDLNGQSGTTSTKRARSLFAIGDAEATTFSGFSVACADLDGSRTGTFIDATSSFCDKDLTIDLMGVTNFYNMIRFRGRGCVVTNSSITSSNNIGTFEWSDDEDSNANHPASMDQRAIVFKNNRLHSITNSFLTVQSGHAYGLTMIGNTCDVGRGTILKCTDEAWGWQISGNTFLGLHCHTSSGTSNGAAISLDGGAKNCVIEGNVFSADPTFWPDGYIPDCFINISGGSGCSITGNTFTHCTSNAINFGTREMVGTSICGNAFDHIGGSPVRFAANADKMAISGNAHTGTGDLWTADDGVKVVVVVDGGMVFGDAVFDAGHGAVLVAPNGTKYRLTVGNDGRIESTAVS